MKRVWLPLALVLLSVCSVQAREVEGVVLSEKLDSAGHALMLNGAGVRSKWFLDLYVAALYLEAPRAGAREVIVADRPMLLRLEIISGLITSEKMEKATREGFVHAAASGYPAQPEQIDAFVDVFRQTINEGDRFDLAYLPERGVLVSKNGELRATLTGLPFKQALWAVWLGDEPAQNSLKQELLGK